MVFVPHIPKPYVLIGSGGGRIGPYGSVDVVEEDQPGPQDPVPRKPRLKKGEAPPDVHPSSDARLPPPPPPDPVKT